MRDGLVGRVQWATEGDAPADRSTIVVVFVSDPEGIVGSDIYVMPWVNLFGVDDEVDSSLGDGGWVVIN